MRRRSPVFALFFLAPLVGEFFLGDFAITLLPLIVVFAPMYGGSAVLIREVARRTGRGWPTMLLLGLAYGVLEEGLVTQSLVNKDYLDQHLLDPGYIPALGTAAPWVIFVVTLHMVWSIGVPIALVEQGSSRHTEPWLGRIGVIVAAVLAVGGAFAMWNSTRTDPSLSHGFLESPEQALIITAVALVLIVIAFLLPKPVTTGRPGSAPAPWAVFVTALAGGAIFMSVTMSWLATWAGITAMLVAIAVTFTLIGIWSRRAAWGPWHRFAAAAGGLLTYSWHTFFMHSATGAIDLISHLVYALAALAILWWVARRMRAMTPVEQAELEPVG